MTRQDIIDKHPTVRYSPGKKAIGSYAIPKGSSFIIIGETTPEIDMERIDKAMGI